jgi:hypothetical protein
MIAKQAGAGYNGTLTLLRELEAAEQVCGQDRAAAPCGS